MGWASINICLKAIQGNQYSGGYKELEMKSKYDPRRQPWCVPGLLLL